jgi:hypothetical protein
MGGKVGVAWKVLDRLGAGWNPVLNQFLNLEDFGNDRFHFRALIHLCMEVGVRLGVKKNIKI